MDIQLVVTNVGFIVGTLLNVAIAVWVIRRGVRKMLGVTFVALNAALVMFQAGHLLGINTYDSELSRQWFTLTLAALFIPPLTIHWIFGVLDELKGMRREIAGLYAVALALSVFYLIRPEAYLGLSITKLEYLPNYYDAGKWFWLVPAFFLATGAHFLYHLIRLHRDANPVVKNRLKYFSGTMLFGGIAGSFVYYLAFDIPINPVWAMFFGLYTIPFAYGIVRYELMDISVVAKRALIYGAAVALVSLLITAVSYLNIVLSEQIENFPLWLIPVVSSVLAVAVGGLVWLRLKEVDVLKYEFITIITHKFRTPLTRIHWSAHDLQREVNSESGKASLFHIMDAGTKLTELTDALVNVAETERSNYTYEFEKVDLKELAEQQCGQIADKFREKGLMLKWALPLDPLPVIVDSKRIQFVIEVLLDNSLSYTPVGGRVDVTVRREGGRAAFSVHDSGIGISSKDLPLVFTKFFRNVQAKLADTEGLGIGLYLSKEVIEKHNGKISAESLGEGKGATFTFRLPLVAK